MTAWRTCIAAKVGRGEGTYASVLGIAEYKENSRFQLITRNRFGDFTDEFNVNIFDSGE